MESLWWLGWWNWLQIPKEKMTKLGCKSSCFEADPITHDNPNIIRPVYTPYLVGSTIHFAILGRVPVSSFRCCSHSHFAPVSPKHSAWSCSYRCSSWPTVANVAPKHGAALRARLLRGRILGGNADGKWRQHDAAQHGARKKWRDGWD